MKKWKIMPLIVLVILLMTGCQETPEKSAVVDKSVGLDAVSYTHLDVYKRQAIKASIRMPSDL